MVQGVEDWLYALPPVTRTYLLLCFVTTIACYLDFVNPFQLVYIQSGIRKGEYWRIVTCFLFLGELSLNSVYAMYLLVRHCKSLEEGSFRGRSADFLWMLLLGAGAMVATAPWSKLHMFGHSLSFMVMYLWAKRNPDLRLSIFGIINCTAPYWPWINVLFAVLMGASPKADLLGIAVGHVYYFLEDVYPRMPGHRRWLGAPAPLKALFGERRAPAAAAQGVAGDAQRQAEGQQHAHID